jgi:hypothetical protein
MAKHGVLESGTLSGLCTGCALGPDCTYPKRQPVMSCLEFEELSGIGTNGSNGHSWHGAARLGVTIETASRPGLCRTCDLEPTCTFPKHPGGVWFCEEYR